MRREDFLCYRDILVMDPGFSFQNGAGVVIFDGVTHRLKACELLRPFARGLNDFRAAEEIRKKTRLFWENYVGFSYDPLHLIIEYPKSYPRSQINQNPLIRIAYLIGMVRADFKTPIEKIQQPYANEWKGNAAKIKTEEFVNESLDGWSARALKRGLLGIPPHLHHNIYDAVGLGLWAIKNIVEKK